MLKKNFFLLTVFLRVSKKHFINEKCTDLKKYIYNFSFY